MQKTELRALGRRQRSEVRARDIEQRESADDVGLDERRRAVDRPVDVRFGREIDDRAGPMRRQQARDEPAIADVAAHESMPRVVLHGAVRLPRLPA